MGPRKMASRYKVRTVRTPGKYRLSKKEPKFRDSLTPYQERDLEQALGNAYIITPEGIAALMEHQISLLPVESRARRTSLVGFAPEENEEE